jgi:hypothetical protein
MLHVVVACCTTRLRPQGTIDTAVRMASGRFESNDRIAADCAVAAVAADIIDVFVVIVVVFSVAMLLVPIRLSRVSPVILRCYRLSSLLLSL